MFIATGYIGAPKAASLTWVDGVGSNGNAHDYTFSGRNLGTPAANRVLIAFCNYSILFSGSFNNISVDGNVMTLVAAPLGGSVGFYILPYPTGTTGTIVISSSGVGNVFANAAYSMWAAYDLRSTTPTASAGQAFGSSPRNVSLNVNHGGICVGAAVGSASSTFSWTGLTVNNQFTYNPGALQLGSASGAFPLAQTPLNVQTTYGGSLSLQACSFR